jgi:hypothetical protein
MGRLMSRPIEEKKNPQQALDETHTTRGLPHRRNTAIRRVAFGGPAT